MINAQRFIKLFMISACFMAVQPSQAMVQNVLDYIKTYKKPVETSVDWLLFTPRIMATTPRLLSERFDERILSSPMGPFCSLHDLKDAPANICNWWKPIALYALLPGI